MWVKKLGDYGRRSRLMIINYSSFNDNPTEKPKAAWKFHTVSPHALYSFVRPYSFIGTVKYLIHISIY